MNTRKYRLAEYIVEGLESRSINSEDLVIVKVPSGLDSITTQTIGQSIVEALRAIDKNNSVILLPDEINIETLDELTMKELGWIKDANATKCDPTISGL